MVREIQFTEIDINDDKIEKFDFTKQDELERLAVDVQYLNFEYTKNVQILNNVNLQIPEGKWS